MRLTALLLLSFSWIAGAQRSTPSAAPAQRFFPDAQVVPGNVSRLTLAWTFHTHALEKPSPRSNSRASFEASPVFWKGLLFFDSPFDQVFAVDAQSGTLKWTYDPGVDREKSIYIVTSRGVTLWHSKAPGSGLCRSDVVLLATEDRRLIELDAATGKLCPAFASGGILDLARGVDVRLPDFYEFTAPPTVVNDVVVVGSTIGDNQDIFVASGAVRGFDVHSGSQLWSWEPLRSPDHHRFGSGNAWAGISADPANDLVFVPTGSPSVDFFGGLRPGDNRDADSIVALRASTGAKVWSYQLVHHDLWDYDTPGEPVLFTFRHAIPAVAVATKTSMVFAFNRLTGQPLWPIEERPVPSSDLPGEQTAPTQPFSSLPALTPQTLRASDIRLPDPADQAYCRELVATFRNDGPFTPPSRRGSIIFPGDVGGANWGSISIDPVTSIMYARVSQLPFVVREELPTPERHGLRNRLVRFQRHHLPPWAGGAYPEITGASQAPDSGGSQLESSPQTGTPFLLQRRALLAKDGAICGPQPYGSIVALNLDTGAKLWSVPHGIMRPGTQGSTGVGGVAVTSTGLIFVASTNDPVLRAYRAADGQEVWRGQLPVSANATPVTYTWKGRQYVVIAAGGHGFMGNGQGDSVVAFALPGKAAPSRHPLGAKPGRVLAR